MCIWVKRVDRWPGEPEAEYHARVKALGEQPFPCRTCVECRQAYEGRLVGDFIAMKQVTQRCLVVLATYNDRYLAAAGRSLDVLQDIDLAKEDARVFVKAFRKMLRRLHPELNVEMSAFRVTEIAPHLSEEASEYEEPDRRDAVLWSATTSNYVRRRKKPRDGPPRAHHHLALWFRVSWKDEARQEREPAQWSDDLIPHLRTDGYLYDHEWEDRAEAKARGGRVRKLATPWPWGYVSYTDAQGGEGSYFAKYAVKCLALREEYNEDPLRARSADEVRNYENAEKTMRSIRRSPRLGCDYYRERARLAAEQGLPPRLYFEFGEGGRPGEQRLVYDHRLGRHVWREGGPFKRTVECPGENLVFSGADRMTVSLRRRVVSPSFLLQRTGRQRAYLSVYDETWEAKNGDRRQPSGPCVRLKKVDGRLQQVLVYGLEEARDQVAKDDARREIAKIERHLGRLLFALSGSEKDGVDLSKRRLRGLRRLKREGHVIPSREEVERASFDFRKTPSAEDTRWKIWQRRILREKAGREQEEAEALVRDVPTGRARGYNHYEAMSRGF